MSANRLMHVFPNRGPLYEWGPETIEPLLPRPMGHYRRPVIIDGANVILCTSEDLARKSIQALLAVMRILIKHNFEVIVVLPEYLLKPYVTRRGWEQLEKLVQIGVINPCSDVANDDLLCFRFALQLGGVVVSRDQFRDLYNIGGPYKRLVHSYSCCTYFVKEKESHVMTKDGHYIGHHTFRFYNKEGLFYSRPKDKHLTLLLHMRYKQRRPVWRAHKAKILTALDDAILTCFIAERKNKMFTKIPSEEERKKYLEIRRKRQELASKSKTPVGKSKTESETPKAEKKLSEKELRHWWNKEMQKLDSTSEQTENEGPSFVRKQYLRKVDEHGQTLIPDPLNLWPKYYEKQRVKQERREKNRRDEPTDPDGDSDCSELSDEDSSVPEEMLRPNYKKIDYIYDDFECYLDPRDAVVPLSQKFAALRAARD